MLTTVGGAAAKRQNYCQSNVTFAKRTKSDSHFYKPILNF